MMPGLAWGLSPFEIGLILVVALLLFGGKKLPELAKAMGRSVNEFKRGMQEINTEVPTSTDAEKAPQSAAKSEEAQPFKEPTQKPGDPGQKA